MNLLLGGFVLGSGRGGFKVFIIGHSMHAKDLHQSNLKENILIVPLSVPLGMAKKIKLIQFFSTLLSNVWQKCRLCTGNDTESSSLSPLEVHSPLEKINIILSTAVLPTFSARKISVLTMVAVRMHRVHFCGRICLFNSLSRFSTEGGLPWQQLCVACKILLGYPFGSRVPKSSRYSCLADKCYISLSQSQSQPCTSLARIALSFSGRFTVLTLHGKS